MVFYFQATSGPEGPTRLAKSVVTNLPDLVLHSFRHSTCNNQQIDVTISSLEVPSIGYRQDWKTLIRQEV